MIVVVGAGSIGRRHAGNIDALGHTAELIPWRSFDHAALEARKDIDGLVIATATDVRLPLVELAAAKGWPIYIEKPLAVSRTEVAAVFEAARPIARRSLAGFMMRYHPIMQALASEDLSDVYRADFEIGHDVRQWRQNWRFADSYAARPHGGGVLLDLCHEIDMAACLFPALDLDAVTSLGHAGFPGVDFATRMTLTADNGPMTSVAMDYVSPVSIRRAGLRGGAASREIDFLQATVTRDGTDTQNFTFERGQMFIDAMRDFLSLIAGDDLSGDPLAPRLDRVRPVADLIARAWEMRRFRGTIDMEMG